MSFGEAVLSVYRNYANFSGRATRAEFWWFILFYVAVSLFFTILLTALIRPGGSTVYTIGFSALALFYLLTVIPYIAVAVRRLHDTDRSGWWLLLGFIPFGGLVLIVLWAQSGTPGPNRYGPDPRMAAGYA
jgi:uncharacterized membrane protein YhaH (DUF805 family)